MFYMVVFRPAQFSDDAFVYGQTSYGLCDMLEEWMSLGVMCLVFMPYVTVFIR